MFVAAVTILVLSVSLALFVSQTFGNLLKYSGKLGGPTALPLVGNGLIFINKTPAEFLLTVGKLIREYGKCFRLWLGTQFLIVVTDPKDIEVTDITRDSFYDSLAKT